MTQGYQAACCASAGQTAVHSLVVILFCDANSADQDQKREIEGKVCCYEGRRSQSYLVRVYVEMLSHGEEEMRERNTETNKAKVWPYYRKTAGRDMLGVVHSQSCCTGQARRKSNLQHTSVGLPQNRLELLCMLHQCHGVRCKLCLHKRKHQLIKVSNLLRNDLRSMGARDKVIQGEG
jgi:hypothetical protein